MKRYDTPLYSMFECDDGEFVRYADIWPRLEAALELIDGQTAGDMHKWSGLSYERCAELWRKVKGI